MINVNFYCILAKNELFLYIFSIVYYSNFLFFRKCWESIPREKSRGKCNGKRMISFSVLTTLKWIWKLIFLNSHGYDSICINVYCFNTECINDVRDYFQWKRFFHDFFCSMFEIHYINSYLKINNLKFTKDSLVKNFLQNR